MKKNFTRVLLAGLLLSAGSMAQATIVYHDVDPDETQSQANAGTQSFIVDMNADNTPDFTLTVFNGDTTISTYSGSGTVVGITAASNNFVAQGTNFPAPQAAAYNSGDEINNGLNWQGSSQALRYNVNVGIPMNNGAFSGDADKYIGVKFTDGTNTYYGWIRVSVNNAGSSYTIKDWAYENTPDAAIAAGDMPVAAVSERLKNSTTIINQNNMLKITFAEPLSGAVHVVNMSGAVVASANIQGMNSEVNLQSMLSGIYNVVVESNEGSFAKKIFVK